MDRSERVLEAVSHFAHKNLLLLLLGSYAAAALSPALGLLIRDVGIERIGPLALSNKISLPMLMLASLLLNASLGVKIGQIRAILRSPGILSAGMAANVLIPIAFIFCVSHLMRLWHNADEVQSILVGLALVASMPIAGSSTAWAQNADGQVALSLGLVLFSTLLSPVTTPIALHAVGFLASGDYAEDLHELAAGGTSTFLAFGVLAPSLLGITSRQIIGGARIDATRPILKLLNTGVLILLNYSNASVSLPQTMADPDADFVALTLGIVTALCALAFAAGGLISWLLKAPPPQRTSLMFGLGMNNNGTGLVIASMALADHPRVMLPIIFYNLVQHLIAGGVDLLMCFGRLHVAAVDRTKPCRWHAAEFNPERTRMRNRLMNGMPVILGLMLCAGVARAAEEEIPVEKLPGAVKKAVKAKFPKAKIAEATKEVENGKTTYEVELKSPDGSIDVAMNEKGKILEIEKVVSFDELPKAVKKALAARFPTAKIEKVEEITKGEDGPISYEIAIKAEVVLNAHGKFVGDKEEEREAKKSVKSKKSKKNKDDDDDDDDEDDNDERVEKDKD